MSCSVNFLSFSEELREKIQTDLTINPKESNYGQKDGIKCWYEDPNCEDNILIPFAYYHTYIRSLHSQLVGNKYDKPADIPENELQTHPNTHLEFDTINNDLKFNGTLTDLQKEIRPEIFDILNEDHSILISLFCGGGKTFLAIYLAYKLKLKTCIIVHRLTIIDQWIFSIQKFIPGAVVQFLKSTSKLNSNADFYVMNVANVQKRKSSDFSNVGLLIVDEAHAVCTDKASQALFWFQPKYVIALTATPKRTDGMDKVLDVHFGTRHVQRKLKRWFNVYKINTGIKPVTQEHPSTGRLDWNLLIESQCLDPERNRLIVNIVRYFSTRNFLILCKRVEQSNRIMKALQDHKENVDIYVATSKKFDVDCRILVTTYSKGGVGFSFDKLDALIIAGDVEEGIEQYSGRIFRRTDHTPMIFDLVDKAYKKHPIGKHYQTRENMYVSFGAIVRDFDLYFPEFKSFHELN